MGSLRSLLSESKRVPVFLIKCPSTLYEVLETWATNCPLDFTEVIGELYGGHEGTSYYYLRDSLREYSGFKVTRDRFYTEVREILIHLWEGKK